VTSGTHAPRGGRNHADALTEITMPVDMFALASAVRSLGDGTFTADLPSEWTVASRPHGGFLLTLLARAAVGAVGAAANSAGPADPLVVSAEFLRPPEVGPVLLRTVVRKLGRTASVVGVSLEQRGRPCVSGAVTVGRLPDETVAWADLPDLPATPPANSLDMATLPAASVFPLASTCDIRLDPANTGFLHGRVGDPLRLRLWAMPRGGTVGPMFALLAGDVSLPVTLNLGRYGWSPTVQLTALLRARPVPGWLRIEVTCRAVHGQWFDEDATVIDSAGQLVCQTRQLALTPVER
jgi:acyl-coenzyme A thioesterase PaaI-like protein